MQKILQNPTCWSLYSQVEIHSGLEKWLALHNCTTSRSLRCNWTTLCLIFLLPGSISNDRCRGSQFPALTFSWYVSWCNRKCCPFLIYDLYMEMYTDIYLTAPEMISQQKNLYVPVMFQLFCMFAMCFILFCLIKFTFFVKSWTWLIQPPRFVSKIIFKLCITWTESWCFVCWGSHGLWGIPSPQ